MITAPDLSIVGVPKAGTTSVHQWLEHRDIVNAAQPKETFFFMDADNPMINDGCNFHHAQSGGYASFFKSNPALHQGGKTLDSTTHHFYQETAVKQLAAHGTKVCVILREPVSRLISYFHYVGYTRSAFKKPLDFSHYVDTLFSHTTDTIRDRFTDEKEFFSLATSLDQGNYQKYLRRWHQHLKPENMKVMLFENLVSQRETFLAELASFFEIPVTETDLQTFDVANEGRAVKFQALNRWVRSISRFATGLPFYEQIKKQYLAVQASEKIEFDQSKHQHAVQRLNEFYRPLNEELAGLIDVDLAKWSI